MSRQSVEVVYEEWILENFIISSYFIERLVLTNSYCIFENKISFYFHRKAYLYSHFNAQHQKY